jgi:hypothetical protein
LFLFLLFLFLFCFVVFVFVFVFSLRTSESNYLVESYVFYDAIHNRNYFGEVFSGRKSVLFILFILFLSFFFFFFSSSFFSLDEEFVEGIKYRSSRKSSPGVLADIQDGTVYQKLFREGFFRHPYNIALGFNTDGVSPYKSSAYEMWPLFWQVHDLPPALRFSLKYTRLCGLWFGKTKPKMNTFLRPFRDELRSFYGMPQPPPPSHSISFSLSNTPPLPPFLSHY